MDLVLVDTAEPIAVQQTPQDTESGAFKTLLAGIQITGSPNYDDWMQELDSIWHSSNAVSWGIGDLMLYGEDKFGEKFAQAVDNTRWKIHTLQNIMTTCRAFPVEERRSNLVFSSHAECASLQGENRKLALDNLESGDWSRADVRKFKREIKGEPDKSRKQALTITPELVRTDDGRWMYAFPNDLPLWIFEKPVTIYVESRAA